MPAARRYKVLAVAFVTLAASTARAKNDGPALPPYILNAHTVAVMIDPEAGVSLRDPNANQTAREDVESAILKWGRFTTVMGAQGADLVIVLRKGHTHAADPVVTDPRQNSRVGSAHATDNGISIGAQHGPQPSLSGAGPSGGPQMGSAQPKVEAATPGDSFEVYEGNTQHPMDAAPGWIYVRKDALHTHDVPAVAEFRKAIEDAEKKAAQKSGKTPAKHP